MYVCLFEGISFTALSLIVYRDVNMCIFFTRILYLYDFIRTVKMSDLSELILVFWGLAFNDTTHVATVHNNNTTNLTNLLLSFMPRQVISN